MARFGEAGAVEERDMELRRAALDRVRVLSARYDDIVPRAILLRGFDLDGDRVSFGSFQDGIFRPRQCRGPAALSIVTTPPKLNRDAPYDDGFNPQTDRFVYHFRTARSASTEALRAAERANATLIAAHRLMVPLIHFHGIAPSQYTPIAPVFVTSVDLVTRAVEVEAALPVTDATDAGLRSPSDVRRYATREAIVRLHQHRFRFDVLRAYAGKCAVCSLREAVLLDAAHILEDRSPQGLAVVPNGISLCAIHHLAYDRNLMGIAPDGVVHIAHRLLKEVDGPMLRTGLQGLHGAAILQPRRTSERPDPERLEVRFTRFRDVA